ncbi:hypothetical protein COV04_02325 [Candidatus Uhrbacteria bacterium CG10_big_fil_rev_8_21_14_0_10_48_11]|uniref:Uncharacterized protein n=1 Tax=Candidatus Uhrbacteria bacterium CG10_big_fil_rev_8_21_14_0_10_48_11 TaxID=1975037 RepID=A0A2M8LF03_9BACT|nr:MAG: hypothetical protein COV04_02325 [Candidatus Uhrbacteria bacterium CG10_big_fil_rev_8_21_14_0_10_48_11]
MAETFANYKKLLTGFARVLTSASGIIAVAVLLLAANELFVRQWLNVPPIAYAVYWIALAGMFIVLARYAWARINPNSTQLLVQAFLVGLGVGLFAALVKVVLYRELWTAFNLFAEPLRTALFGIVLVWFMAHIDERHHSSLTTH